MKKPKIEVDRDKMTVIWGYSFKECIDYIQFKYKIEKNIINDIIDWVHPSIFEYPFFICKKVTENIPNPHEEIVDQILIDLYGLTTHKNKDKLITVVELIFKEFSINHTIENIPIVPFLKF